MGDYLLGENKTEVVISMVYDERKEMMVTKVNIGKREILKCVNRD